MDKVFIIFLSAGQRARTCCFRRCITTSSVLADPLGDKFLDQKGLFSASFTEYRQLRKIGIDVLPFLNDGLAGTSSASNWSKLVFLPLKLFQNLY